MSRSFILSVSYVCFVSQPVSYHIVPLFSMNIFYIFFLVRKFIYRRSEFLKYLTSKISFKSSICTFFRQAFLQLVLTTEKFRFCFLESIISLTQRPLQLSDFHLVLHENNLFQFIPNLFRSVSLVWPRNHLK